MNNNLLQQVLSVWREMEKFADTCQSYPATSSFLNSLPQDSPFIPHLPTLFQQIRTIDLQNPDKWPDPQGSQTLINFHKLRLSMYLLYLSLSSLSLPKNSFLHSKTINTIITIMVFVLCCYTEYLEEGEGSARRGRGL